jgi:hypothetical protein
VLHKIEHTHTQKTETNLRGGRVVGVVAAAAIRSRYRLHTHTRSSIAHANVHASINVKRGGDGDVPAWRRRCDRSACEAPSARPDPAAATRTLVALLTISAISLSACELCANERLTSLRIAHWRRIQHSAVHISVVVVVVIVKRCLFVCLFF